jgi:hypothetical protein
MGVICGRDITECEIYRQNLIDVPNSLGYAKKLTQNTAKKKKND